MERIFLMQNPAVEILIKNIKDTSGKISISGIVTFVGINFCIIDDGSGQAQVLGDSSNVVLGTYIRVFGQTLMLQEGIHVKAELIQDLPKINPKLHKRVKELLQ